MCNAYLAKNNWESRTQLSTITGVDQVDDDTLVYYRRVELFNASIPAWERVTVNRKEQTMKCENVGLNTDMTEGVMNYHTFQAMGEHTQNMYSIMTSNRPTTAVDLFQNSVKQTLRAIQFLRFEAEE